jgi:hypothetical protein
MRQRAISPSAGAQSVGGTWAPEGVLTLPALATERRLGETALSVLPSTSPANAAVPWDERLRWFRSLRELV